MFKAIEWGHSMYLKPADIKITVFTNCYLVFLNKAKCTIHTVNEYVL